jgi:hypothetical protein
LVLSILVLNARPGCQKVAIMRIAAESGTEPFVSFRLHSTLLLSLPPTSNWQQMPLRLIAADFAHLDRELFRNLLRLGQSKGGILIPPESMWGS